MTKRTFADRGSHIARQVPSQTRSRAARILGEDCIRPYLRHLPLMLWLFQMERNSLRTAPV